MEKTKITVTTSVSSKQKTDLLIFCVGQKRKDTPHFTRITHRLFKKAVKLGDFSGNGKDQLLFYGDDKNLPIKSTRVAFVGTGLMNKSVGHDQLMEKMRIAGGNIAGLCAKLKTTKLCVMPAELAEKSNLSACVSALTEGILLGDYTFKKYKTENQKKSTYAGIKELRFIVDEQLKVSREKVKRAQTAAISACHARDMANEPGNSWTPQSFADYAQDIAAKYKLKCHIFEKKKLEKLGMGGILAVNKGSAIPPKLVIVEHLVSKKAKTLLLVGKGLTFDSGGVSLKPAAGMEDMKYDMCGGAAVLSAMNAVGCEKPLCNVIAIVPTTDNMSGSGALKPGDIIYHYNKITSEIINTDAEGRLILADALAYGIEKYKPDYAIDLATLTGAVIIGLGHHHTGLLSNNDRLTKLITASGARCGEPIWRLPLGEEYKKQLESKVADMKNTGGRPGGTITAAEYLHKFVGETPWAHLDIAGTAWGYTEKSYIPKNGPSGICVRTLIDLIRNLS